MRRMGRCSLHSGEGMKELGSGDKHSAACSAGPGSLGGQQGAWQGSSPPAAGPVPAKLLAGSAPMLQFVLLTHAMLESALNSNSATPVLLSTVLLPRIPEGEQLQAKKIANAIKYLSGTLTASVKHSGVRCPSWLDLLRNL